MSALLRQRTLINTCHEFLRSANPHAGLRACTSRSPLRRCQHSSARESRLPAIISPSFWRSLLPRGLKERFRKTTAQQAENRGNPANYFIWIYLFIGSQAIRILGLKNEHKDYMRKAELKLGLLREVIERLQRGEEVDVEKALGTGDEIQEREWEDALKELEDEERIWQKSREHVRKQEQEKAATQEDANPVNATHIDTLPIAGITRPGTAPQAPGFY